MANVMLLIVTVAKITWALLVCVDNTSPELWMLPLTGVILHKAVPAGSGIILNGQGPLRMVWG
jgi:hypothetical protein